MPAGSSGAIRPKVTPPPMCCLSGQSALSAFITISVSIVSPLLVFGP
jgi:hypothetical protein